MSEMLFSKTTVSSLIVCVYKIPAQTFMISWKLINEYLPQEIRKWRIISKHTIHLYYVKRDEEMKSLKPVCCVIGCRYQLSTALNVSKDTVYYYVDTLASLLLKVILLLKINFLSKLSTSNLGSHGSPVNFLHQLESEKVPLDTISHLSPLTLTKLLWYQKREEWVSVHRC